MGGLRMRKNPGFKIILGLMFPPTIAKLEFKTREELELMPQTEEELQVHYAMLCSAFWCYRAKLAAHHKWGASSTRWHSWS